MKTSDAGRKFIESWEGLILGAYDDHNDHIVPVGGTPIGVLTIGYGHTDAAGPPKVYVGQKITQQEADNFLASDLASVENEVNHLVKVPLNQNQFDALVSFQFNTGWLGHPGCSLLSALNGGNYDLAANDFKLYDHAGGKVLAGLTKRRTAERTMFLAPVSPVNVVHGPAAGAAVIVVGSSVAANYHSPMIFLVTLGVALVAGLVIHYLVNRKV